MKKVLFFIWILCSVIFYFIIPDLYVSIGLVIIFAILEICIYQENEKRQEKRGVIEQYLEELKTVEMDSKLIKLLELCELKYDKDMHIVEFIRKNIKTIVGKLVVEKYLENHNYIPPIEKEE